MRLKSKAAVLLAAAAMVVAASVATAFAAAAQQTIALKPGDEGTGFAGTYGTEVVLTPASMSSIELPGDKIHFQAYVQDVETSGTGIPTAMKWMDFQDFEDIQLEVTNTVLPFSYLIGTDDKVILSDGTAISPFLAQPTVDGTYLIRAEYKPAGSSSAPASFSETETVTLIKNTSTKVAISTSGTIRKSGTKLSFRVSPNCGVGTVRVTVSKGTSSKTYNLVTDEDGRVSATIKLGSNLGKYKISAKFMGNVFGVASPTAVRYVIANR